MKKTLWTRNFTLITLGTIVSIIGSQVIKIPLSLTVFAQTKSVLQSGLMLVAGMVPSAILPIFAAPFIDRNRKKPIIVGMDYLLAAVYLLLGIAISRLGFHYSLYVACSFVFGLIDAVYYNTYIAWYPDLITPGFEQKGYAIMGALYPTISIVMAPFSAWLYQVMEMHAMFYIVGGLLIVAATFELFTVERFTPKSSGGKGFAAYRKDMLAGFRYIRKEKGIRNIYLYMGVTQGVTVGNRMLIQAFFQSTAWLGATLFGFLVSAETIGRTVGSFLQYHIDVPARKRYGITKTVYYLYELFDIALLFLPFPLMLVNRFTVGGLGVTSAVIRSASVQSYLDPGMRAKVHAVFNSYSYFMMILFQIAAGVAGDLLGYRAGILVFSTLCLGVVYLLIQRPSDINRTVYEAERSSLESGEA